MQTDTILALSAYGDKHNSSNLLYDHPTQSWTHSVPFSIHPKISDHYIPANMASVSCKRNSNDPASKDPDPPMKSSHIHELLTHFNSHQVRIFPRILKECLKTESGKCLNVDVEDTFLADEINGFVPISFSNAITNSTERSNRGNYTIVFPRDLLLGTLSY